MNVGSTVKKLEHDLHELPSRKKLFFVAVSTLIGGTAVAVGVYIIIFSLFTSTKIDDYLFVDGSFLEEEIGSFEKPFRTISAAITAIEADDALPKHISVLPGTYEEDIVLSQSIELLGYGDGVLIKSPDQVHGKTVLIKDDTRSTVAFVEVDGGESGIYVEPHGSAIVVGATMNNAHRYGMWSKSGEPPNTEREIYVINSDASHNGKQGLYLFDGITRIKGTTVTFNKEEGIDLHEDMDVYAVGNTVTDNGEGGIETDIGYNRIELVSNIIERNGNSGINLQTGRGVGEIILTDNWIVENGDWGIECKNHDRIPEEAPRPYFPSIVTFKNNKIGQNVSGDRSGRCMRDGSAESWSLPSQSDLLNN
jgi:hypothetical protein